MGVLLVKHCTKCNKIFPATNEFFALHNQLKDGLDTVCKKCKRKRSIEFYMKNLEQERVRGRKKAKRDSVKNKLRSIKWANDNPDKIRDNYVRYRFAKKNQTPILTKEEKKQIVLIYKQAVILGQNWHVDHIIPLAKGGLHHPDNLQIVVKKYNLEKGSKLNFRLPLDMEVYRWPA